MPKWCQGEQGSSLWLRERVGCLTASMMSVARETLKKGGESEKRRKYKLQLVAERLTGQATESYVNYNMERGIEQEPFARAAYEEHTGNLVELCGFALHDTIDWLGCSPDGLLDHDGLIEIKNPTTIVHLEWRLADVVPEQHKDQMLLQCLVTGRKWVDFVSYDCRLPEEYRLFIKRYTPTDVELVAVGADAKQFLLEVQDIHDKLTQGAAA